MKRTTIGIFADRGDAEKFINYAHNELKLPHEDISYIYKDIFGNKKEVSTEDVASNTMGEGAGRGAKTGAVIGALGGIAAIAGVIPVIGPLFVAGPILAALGITGAVGATAAGAVTGAAVGGIVGALANMGVGHEKAVEYQDRVLAGNILVSVNSEKDGEVEASMQEHGALQVNTYQIAI
jgi:hypothetical protein